MQDKFTNTDILSIALGTETTKSMHTYTLELQAHLRIKSTGILQFVGS